MLGSFGRGWEWTRIWASYFFAAHGDLGFYRQGLISVSAWAIARVDTTLLFHIWYTPDVKYRMFAPYLSADGYLLDYL